jgi:hypothetical protein
MRLLRDAIVSREALTLLLTISWFWFLGATFLSLAPVYGKDLLQADERAVTLLNAAFTVGIGIGSFACETLSRRQIELGLIPPAAMGLTLFAADVWLQGVPSPAATTITVGTFFTDPRAVRIFLDLVGLGACGALYIVPLNAALQARAESSRRARVIGALNVLNALFVVVSALFTAVLYQFTVSIPTIFLIVAGLNVIALGVSLWALPEFGIRLRYLVRRR